MLSGQAEDRGECCWFRTTSILECIWRLTRPYDAKFSLARSSAKSSALVFLKILPGLSASNVTFFLIGESAISRSLARRS